MIPRLILMAAALAGLTACGGGKPRAVGDETVQIQKGVYVYNPNKRHAPVSLSSSDLQGMVIQ